MKMLFSILGLSLTFLLSWLTTADIDRVRSNIGEKPVAEVIKELGDDSNPNEVESGNMVSAQKGEQLVKMGYTTNAKGKRTRQQSKYFDCLACHNIEREDPDLTLSDPQLRLQYVAAKGMPLLPATTFYGIVDRETFYNDDYIKKYGELTLKARNSIRESIQLCATECAQGRALADWEIESVLAYFWTLGLKMDDLALSNVELEDISQALAKGQQSAELVELIKSKYLNHSPAHTEKPIVTREERYEMSGDPLNGMLVYEVSCQHCHYDNQYSFRILDNEKLTFKRLRDDFKDYHKQSIFEVTRWGTEALIGKKAYMPFYTKERLSNQQIKDLAAYINYRCEQ